MAEHGPDPQRRAGRRMPGLEHGREPAKLTPVEQAVAAFEAQALKSPELARETFWRLLDNIKECQRRVNRSLILMAVFALLFELLNRGLVSEASVGGLRLTGLESLIFVPPIAIGFEIFYAMSAIRDRNVMISAYGRLSSAIYPDLNESHVDALLVTPSGFVTPNFPSVFINARAFRLSAILGASEYVMFGLVLPIALPAYTIAQLYGHYGIGAWQSWISAVLTSAFVVIGFATLFSMEMEDEEH